MKTFLLALMIGLSTLSTKAPVLKDSVYQKAMHAYNIEKHHNKNLKPYLTIIDYTLPKESKRMWIIDTRDGQIIYQGLVAHGTNSGDSYITSVSNKIDSKKSSIGVFLTLGTYWGHAGLSLKIKGLEPGINDNVYDRHIVVHGANYVNSHHVGYSWGCFAIPRSYTNFVINTIKNNSLMFVYYPDQHWLKHSKYLN